MTKAELDYWLGEIGTSIFSCYESNNRDVKKYKIEKDEEFLDELDSFKEIIRLAKIGLQVENIVKREE